MALLWDCCMGCWRSPGEDPLLAVSFVESCHVWNVKEISVQNLKVGIMCRGNGFMQFPIIHRQRLFAVKKELLHAQGNVVLEHGALSINAHENPSNFQHRAFNELSFMNSKPLCWSS